MQFHAPGEDVAKHAGSFAAFGCRKTPRAGAIQLDGRMVERLHADMPGPRLRSPTRSPR